MRPNSDAAEVAQLVEWLAQDYQRVRVLPDGSIACLGRLMYTTAIFLGVDRYGWSRRFCFKDHGLAARRFEELEGEDSEPAGYIARR